MAAPARKETEMYILILIAAAVAVCAAMLLRGKAWQDFIDRHKQDRS